MKSRFILNFITIQWTVINLWVKSESSPYLLLLDGGPSIADGFIISLLWICQMLETAQHKEPSWIVASELRESSNKWTTKTQFHSKVYNFMNTAASPLIPSLSLSGSQIFHI